MLRFLALKGPAVRRAFKILLKFTQRQAAQGSGTRKTKQRSPG